LRHPASGGDPPLIWGPAPGHSSIPHQRQRQRSGDVGGGGSSGGGGGGKLRSGAAPRLSAKPRTTEEAAHHRSEEEFPRECAKNANAVLPACPAASHGSLEDLLRNADVVCRGGTGRSGGGIYSGEDDGVASGADCARAIRKLTPAALSHDDAYFALLASPCTKGFHSFTSHLNLSRFRH